MIEFGYKIKDGKVVVHDINSKAVTAIHEWYIESDSIYSVLTFLDASEYMSPGGFKKWTRATVRKILGNPIYKGTDIFPRILPDEIVDKVNSIFENKNRRKPVEQKHSEGLANVCCNKCGCTMKPSNIDKTIYECKCASITVDFIKEAFEALSNAIYQDPKMIEHFHLEQIDPKLFESLNYQINEAINNIQYSHYNVLKLLKERAALAYTLAKINDSEMKSMNILNAFFRSKQIAGFDEDLYSCTVQKVSVMHSNLIEIELINGQRFEFLNED